MRGRRSTVLRAGAVLGAGLVVYAYWLVHPPSVSSPTADAVISHAGGEGDRLDRALELMEQDAAPTLVLLLGSTRSDRAAAMCGQRQPYEVLCVDPDPVNTEGEARTAARLAEERGWTRLIAVTSDYHLRRALLVDRRCSGLQVIGSASRNQRGFLPLARLVAKEMVALPWAALTAC
jgi:uncharacterized SAM-binding protein YcdF (DUF218 family)